MNIKALNRMKKKLRYCFIRLYKNNRYVGSIYVPEHSTGSLRKRIANKRGIMYYNQMDFPGRQGKKTPTKFIFKNMGIIGDCD